jgi:hypothetical protein
VRLRGRFYPQKSSGKSTEWFKEDFMPTRSIRTLLFTAALTAFAVCLAQTASAQTYRPSTVICLSGNVGGILYEPQDVNYPIYATGSGTMELDGDDNSYTEALCTWSDFGTGTTTSDMTLTVGVSATGTYNALNPSDCWGTVSVSTGSTGIWHSTCVNVGTTKTANVPAGTNLATYSVTGSEILNSNGKNNQDAEITLTFTSITIN